MLFSSNQDRLIVLFFLFFAGLQRALEDSMGSGHGDLLEFFLVQLLEANELEVSKVGFLILDGVSHTDVASLGTGFLGQSHNVQKGGLGEGVHGLFSGDFNEELLGGVVHIASEGTVGVGLLSFGNENHGVDLVGGDSLGVEGKFGHEDFIIGGQGDFSQLGHIGSRFFNEGAFDAKSSADRHDPLRKKGTWYY